MNKKMMGFSVVLVILIGIRILLGVNLEVETTVHSLEKNAEVIVGGICNESELIQTVNQEDGSFISQEKTDFTIYKVYKSDKKAEDIKVDNDIFVYEEQLLRPDSVEGQNTNIANVDGFATMSITCKYIIYLKYSESKEMYETLKYGVIPINSEETMYVADKDHATLESKRNAEVQQKVIQQVTEKYGYREDVEFTRDNFGMILLCIVNLMLLVVILILLILVVRVLLKKNSTKELKNEKTALRKSLGEALKEERMRCKMTQEFVAESVGVSRQAVSKWESGASDPSTSNLIALTKLYQITTEELLKGVENS